MDTCRALKCVPLSLLSTVVFASAALLARAQVTTPELLPTGMTITPLAPRGVVFQTLNPGLPSLPEFKADMAVTLALSPDGRSLLALTSGFNQNLDASGNVDPATSNEYVFVYDVSGRQPVETQVLQIQTNAFDGLVWRPDGKEFYVSGGPDDLVHVFAQGTGGWTESPSIPLNHNGVGLGLYGILPVVAGLAVTANGKHLLAANYENDSVSAIDLTTHSVESELDLRPGMIDPADNGAPGGTYPYWIAVRGSDRAFVSSQRDREVDVLDLSALPTLRVIDRIKLPGQPNKMILDRSGRRLFVAQDNTDTVAVVDTNNDQVAAEIDTIAPPAVFANPAKFKGAGPNSLALSPDEKWLYVTNGGTNSVSIIRLAASAGARKGPVQQTVGLIPTAWYPNAVTVSRDGSMLYVVNGKSMPGANPKACIDSAAVASDYDDYSCAATNQYIYQIMHADLASFPVPAPGELEQLTRQVAKNDGFRAIADDDDEEDRTPDGGSPQRITRRDREMMEFLHQRIRHVLFIVKENKTYDQVLGDLEVGNGDPDLVALPEVLTPNHHRLARKFVTLDNTYCSGEVSGDGWNWSSAARVTEMEQKTIQLDYTFSTRAPIYDFDGTNRNINVGLSTVQDRIAANPDTPNDANLLAGTRDVAEHDGDDNPGAGYLWDAALNARKTVRNYGFEYIDLNRYFVDPSDPGYIPVLREPFKAGVVVSRATKPSLEANTDPYYRGWDMAIADFWLEKEWEREFDGFVANGNLPNLELIALPHDHFGDVGPDGGAIDGVNTIETQMADNDYALGRIVEKVSTSRYWDDTLILVIEDDAQDGPDHVDAHRTIAYAIGPYVKRGQVVSTRYSTINMLRTIEDILHLKPMGLNDGLQPPMTDVFTRERKTWTYHPIVPDVLRTTQLPLPPPTPGNSLVKTERIEAFKRAARDAGYWADRTQGLDFTRSDHADTVRFNRVLWAGLRGENSAYPVSRSQLNLRTNREKLIEAAAERRNQASVNEENLLSILPMFNEF
jgi:DNA-binding beta-propeller fold protein YncE